MKRLTLILIALSALMTIKAGDATQVSYAKYASTCMYSFLRYIQWPNETNSNHFNIAIIGDIEVYEETRTLVDGKQVGAKSYHVEFFKKADDVTGQFQMVFLDDLQTFKIKKVLENPATESSLLVTEAENATMKGAMINFVPNDGKIRFELSKGNINDRGLKVSSSLYNLALVVD